MPIKKGKKLCVPNLQHCQNVTLQNGSETFFIKISWIWTCSKILEKLAIEKIATILNDVK